MKQIESRIKTIKQIKSKIEEDDEEEECDVSTFRVQLLALA